jgi:SAM-dependent methyltransferase
MDLLERRSGESRRHPWELARADLLVRVLASHAGVLHDAALLDVGAGDGWAGDRIRDAVRARRLVCWDSGYSEALVRQLRVVNPGAEFTASAPTEQFDLVLLLDVLEHVEDDRAFAAEVVRRNVRAGGLALVSVPAWPALHSSHDVRLRHFRRYTPARCRAVLEGSGLRILESGGAFHSLALVRAAQNLIEMSGGPPPKDAGRWEGGTATTALVSFALRIERRISIAASRFRWNVPGLSWWALCQRVI